MFVCFSKVKVQTRIVYSERTANHEHIEITPTVFKCIILYGVIFQKRGTSGERMLASASYLSIYEGIFDTENCSTVLGN